MLALGRPAFSMGRHGSPFATLAATLALFVLVAALPAGAQMPPNPPVEVARPLSDKVTDYVVYTGRFEAVERVVLRARVSGYLDSVGFEDGSIVEKDQILFTIDRRPFEAAVNRAEAALESAKAGRELAKLELDRAEQLASRNVGTVQEVDRTRATLTQADANVAIAEAELRTARLDLEFTEIRAPFTGRISARAVDPGNLIVGGTTQATALGTLVSIDPIHFEFTTSEADYLRYPRGNRVATGSAAEMPKIKVGIRLMNEDTFRHPGVLEFIDNEFDPNSGTITGRALVENPQHLILPGVFGRVRVPASEAHDALLIPDEAIISDQARKIVMTVDAEGKVVPKPVVPGQLHRGLRVVNEGLTADDRVIVAGVQRARPGQGVTANEVTIELGAE
ncbi:efflux RND transporter periplasmic adaptor subunit [Limibaculum sp. M0105]|uniref:Efflux RND transporter periplasmic adaptor subunit n=1 Tax=Thermohalobaculum xanthum TaxID=2753746 RepID=A0A8J7M7D5_9RHOB|nr:efflux RND transporter periplasmic adaptor subunit [Thermohalobaculum xanthum]MBK0398904.1 efflux RND transporter periplasmic adaptor subunit [Thermohalobaculum xanthum]